MPTRDMPTPASAIAASGRSNYPKPFASRVSGREKQKLGDAFGLSNFGVNRTRLAPGAISSLYHTHSRQDEFIYILEGNPTLMIGDHAHEMSPGDCMGFAAGSERGHHLVNNSDATVTYLEIGDRSRDDEVKYPNDDLAARMTDEGTWAFVHKDGSPY